VPRAAALAAAANPDVLPAERLRLWHVADVAALEAGKAKAKPSVKYGGVFVRASVADGSRLSLDGIPMTLDNQKHFKMNGVVFGVAIGDSKGCVMSLSRNASTTTGFPAVGSSFKKALYIEGRDVEVTFTVSGIFAAGGEADEDDEAGGDAGEEAGDEAGDEAGGGAARYAQ